MNLAVLGAAAVVTVTMLLRNSVGFFRHPAAWGLETYHLFADVWLVGILPVTLDPFLASVTTIISSGSTATGCR